MGQGRRGDCWEYMYACSVENFPYSLGRVIAGVAGEATS